MPLGQPWDSYTAERSHSCLWPAFRGIYREIVYGRCSSWIVSIILILNPYICILSLKPRWAPGTKINLREVIKFGKCLAGNTIGRAVLGSIWGVFTPIEAAGVGAFLAMIITLIRKKLTMNTLLDALTSSIRVSTMIFTMFIGATLFSYFLTSTGVPKQIGDYLASLSVPPTVILSCIMLVYFIYGCIMDEAGLLMISLPIFLPIVKAIGVDLIAFGVLVMIVMGTGMTTPPVGLNVFIVSGIVKEKGISMSTIYQGVLPFVGAMVIMIALLIAFPQIALFLPNLMIGN